MLLPPSISTVPAWAEGDQTQQGIDVCSAPGSVWLILRFNRAGHGILLEGRTNPARRGVLLVVLGDGLLFWLQVGCRTCPGSQDLPVS
jgi:hypothetical protein